MSLDRIFQNSIAIARDDILINLIEKGAKPTQRNLLFCVEDYNVPLLTEIIKHVPAGYDEFVEALNDDCCGEFGYEEILEVVKILLTNHILSDEEKEEIITLAIKVDIPKVVDLLLDTLLVVPTMQITPLINSCNKSNAGMITDLLDESSEVELKEAIDHCIKEGLLLSLGVLENFMFTMGYESNFINDCKQNNMRAVINSTYVSKELREAGINACSENGNYELGLLIMQANK